MINRCCLQWCLARCLKSLSGDIRSRMWYVRRSLGIVYFDFSRAKTINIFGISVELERFINHATFILFLGLSQLWFQIRQLSRLFQIRRLHPIIFGCGLIGSGETSAQTILSSFLWLLCFLDNKIYCRAVYLEFSKTLGFIFFSWQIHPNDQSVKLIRYL